MECGRKVERILRTAVFISISPPIKISTMVTKIYLQMGRHCLVKSQTLCEVEADVKWLEWDSIACSDLVNSPLGLTSIAYTFLSVP